MRHEPACSQHTPGLTKVNNDGGKSLQRIQKSGGINFNILQINDFFHN